MLLKMEVFIVCVQQTCVAKAEEKSRSSLYLVWSRFAFLTASVLLGWPAHSFLKAGRSNAAPNSSRNLHHAPPLPADTLQHRSPAGLLLQPKVPYSHSPAASSLQPTSCDLQPSRPVSMSEVWLFDATLDHFWPDFSQQYFKEKVAWCVFHLLCSGSSSLTN